MPRAIACASAPTIRAIPTGARGFPQRLPGDTPTRGCLWQAPSFYGRDGRGAQSWNSWAIQTSMIHGSNKTSKSRTFGSEMNPNVSSDLICYSCFLVHWISPYTFFSEAACRVEILPQTQDLLVLLERLDPAFQAPGPRGVGEGVSGKSDWWRVV